MTLLTFYFSLFSSVYKQCLHARMDATPLDWVTSVNLVFKLVTIKSRIGLKKLFHQYFFKAFNVIGKQQLRTITVIVMSNNTNNDLNVYTIYYRWSIQIYLYKIQYILQLHISMCYLYSAATRQSIDLDNSNNS